MLLATIAHRLAPENTAIAHAVGPAVADESTERVYCHAKEEGWQLHCIDAGEFADHQYRANPVNRCYYCKSHLFAAIHGEFCAWSSVIMTGTNLDDLGEYRPGIRAARENGVVEPYVEAGFGKEDIRAVARQLRLSFAEIPASPCLASRIYSGTRIEADLLAAVQMAEAVVRDMTGIQVVRCRVRDDQALIEVPGENIPDIDDEIISTVHWAIATCTDRISNVVADPNPYRPGRAFRNVA